MACPFRHHATRAPNVLQMIIVKPDGAFTFATVIRQRHRVCLKKQIKSLQSAAVATIR